VNPLLRQLLPQFAPDLARQLESAERILFAFSQALTTEQQVAMRLVIQNGPDAFINWSRTETGITAIRNIVDVFTNNRLINS